MEKETAMKILKELHDNSLFSNRIALETIIPELADGNDERIRKDIIAYIKKANGEPNNILPSGSYCVLEMITWLEKQGKQKSINDTDEEVVNAVKDTSVLDMIEQKQEWSIEESYINNAIAACRSLYGEYSETAHWLESLKERLQPKQAWSEEDEEMFDFCCNYLDDNQIAFLERLKARMQGKED